MATNVYRAEERIYFGDTVHIEQGYYITTTSDSITILGDNETLWGCLEGRAAEMFPGCDPVRVAGFALLAHQDDEWSDEASTDLEEEIGAEAMNGESVFDIIDRLILGAPLPNAE